MCELPRLSFTLCLDIFSTEQVFSLILRSCFLIFSSQDAIARNHRKKLLQGIILNSTRPKSLLKHQLPTVLLHQLQAPLPILAQESLSWLLTQLYSTVSSEVTAPGVHHNNHAIALELWSYLRRISCAEDVAISCLITIWLVSQHAKTRHDESVIWYHLQPGFDSAHSTRCDVVEKSFHHLTTNFAVPVWSTPLTDPWPTIQSSEHFAFSTTTT